MEISSKDEIGPAGLARAWQPMPDRNLVFRIRALFGYLGIVQACDFLADEMSYLPLKSPIKRKIGQLSKGKKDDETLFVDSIALFLCTPAEYCARACCPPPEATAPAISGDKIWADLMEGNQRFVSGQTKSREMVQLRRTLAKGQHPRVVVLTCSDSRVPPDLVFDQNLGDLFVIHAAGNVADAIELGRIEYAVEHLGNTLLVVLGHEKCGAVTAVCSREKMPTAKLHAIVDKIDPAVARARTYAGADGLLDAAILENIHRSARDVLANSDVLGHATRKAGSQWLKPSTSWRRGRWRLPSTVDYR